MKKKAHYLAVDKCPHGMVALSINNDIGGTRLTGGCCGSWTTHLEFPVDVDSLIGLLSPYATKNLTADNTTLRAEVEKYKREYVHQDMLLDEQDKVGTLTAANAALTERVLKAERERDEARGSVCEWTRPKGWEGMYDTCNGHLIDYEEAFKYCPYCGRKIKIAEAK